MASISNVKVSSGDKTLIAEGTGTYDADNRVAASWDWNKVVRADYDDLVYCRMGIEAQDIFKSDPLWQPYFHETGMYNNGVILLRKWISNAATARSIMV